MYIDDGLLALDACLEARLGDLHIQIFALNVGGDDGAEIHITNGLSPFVRQLALLVFLLLLGLFVQTLALLGGWR